MTIMVETIMSLLALATLALAAFGLGRPLVRGLRLDLEDSLARAVWSLAAGLVAAGLAWAVLGMVGWLHQGLIGVATLAAGFWGIGEISRTQHPPRYAAAKTATAATPQPQWARPADGLFIALLVLAAVAAAGSLLAALAPPTAGDALCYHLELPKRFLAQRAVVYLPDSDNSTYPLLVEMWYLWALALDGPVAAQLVHWGLGLLLALSTVVLATPVVGRAWGRCAGCIVLLTPGISNQMTAPLNDVGLAAFTTLALAAWWRAAVDDETPRWYVMTGWLLGGALGIKHVALLAVAAAGAGTAWLWWKQPQRRRRLLEGTATLAIVAASTSGLWYLRAAWHHGNPVHPFFDEYLGGPARPTLPADKAPLGRNPLVLAAAPWQLTMHPERFGGRGHQLGALFLATLPGLLVSRRLRGLGLLLSMAGIYAVGWFFLRQNERFLLPLVPWLAIPVVWVWAEWRRMPRAAALVCGGATAALLLVGAAAAAWRARDTWRVVVGRESRDEYLLRREPSYEVAAWANSFLDSQAHILSQEQRAFYFHARVTRENVYRRRTGYDRCGASPAEICRRLRAAGFTHVLLAEAASGAAAHYNPTLSSLIDPPDPPDSAGRTAPVDWLAEFETIDADGSLRRYRLAALRP